MTDTSKRKLVKALAAGGGIAAVLPTDWKKPIVKAVTVPAHAATSPAACGREFTLESDIDLFIIAIADGTSGEIIICSGEAGGYNELIDVEDQINFDCFDYTVSGTGDLSVGMDSCPYEATVSVSVLAQTATIDLSMTIDCANVAGLTGETTITGSEQFTTQIFSGTPGDCNTRICGMLSAQLVACLDGDEATAQALIEGLQALLTSCEDPCESGVS